MNKKYLRIEDRREGAVYAIPNDIEIDVQPPGDWCWIISMGDPDRPEGYKWGMAKIEGDTIIVE